MFTIITQQKKLFMNMLESSFAGNSEAVSDTPEVQKEAPQSQMDQFKSQYIQKLQALSEKKNAWKSLTDADKSTIDTAKKFADLYEVYQAEKNLDKNQSRDLRELLKNLVETQVNVKSDTQEKIKTIEDTKVTMDIKFGFWETDFAWLRKNINNASYEEMVRSMSYSQLKTFVKELKDTADRNNLDTDKKWYNLNPTNISELKAVLKKNGYESKGWMWGIEMGSLLELFRNVLSTQEKVRSFSSFQDKMALVFDHNQDGLLDNKVHFYTKEMELFSAVQTEAQFNNLIQNLWYTNAQDFYEKLNNNYFSTRAELKERLWSVLAVEHVLNPAEMLRNPNALQEFNEFKSQALKNAQEVGKNLYHHEKIKYLPEETKKALELETIGVVMSSQLSAGVSFNVQEATNNIIDSLAFGVINGIPGVGIAKQIYQTENKRLAVNVGMMNLVPFVGAKWILKEGEVEEMKKLFDREIDGSSEITLGVWVSTIGNWVSVDMKNVNEKSKLGIEKAKEKMGKELDLLFNSIESWKPFKDTKFRREDNSQHNEVIYQRLQEMYKAQGPESLKYLKEGALKNYERALYQNAQGINLTGFWVGLISLVGYLPIPIVLVHGEKHKTKWNEVETYKSNNAVVSEKTDLAVTRQEKVSQTIETKKVETGEYFQATSVEINQDLLARIESMESWFSANTRANVGAYDFINPEKNLLERWNGLKSLSKIPALRKVWVYALVHESHSDADKQLIISTLAQYIKKSRSYNNGSISEWNTNKEKLIKTDRDRRKGFDTLFWFSLQKEAEQYYNTVQSSSEKIDNVLIQWVWFDAVSSLWVELKHRVQGIDSFYTNLNVLTLGGKPLLVPIIDSSKINAFVAKLEKLNHFSSADKQEMIEWLKNGSLELNYYKDTDGFNDRILLKRVSWTPVVTQPDTPVEIPQDEETPKNISVHQPKYTTTNLIWGVTGDVEKKEKTTWDSRPWHDWEDTGPGGGWGGDANSENWGRN